MASDLNIVTIVQTIALILGALTGIAVFGSLFYWAGQLQKGQKTIEATIVDRRSTVDDRFVRIEGKIDKVDTKVDSLKSTILSLHATPQGGSGGESLDSAP